MALTEQQLDELCGGAPTYQAQCPRIGCKKKFGRYYSEAVANSVVRTHIRNSHTHGGDIDSTFGKKHRNDPG